MSILDLTTSLDDAVADLRTRVAGAVLTERDPNYAEHCAAWNLVFQHHPAVLVVAESPIDIVEAVRFARAGGFRVAVQATGHGPARTADGAVMIVTSKLTTVTIDPSARTAKVAAGAKWGAVLAPAQEHGLAPLLGSTTDVGAIGYTLGGGMGWLARRYGLASDSVRSFEIVTPEGELVRASSGENAELFWALKGGGAGTFGVVTSMEIDLFPVDTVYAGNLLYPIEMAAEVVARWRNWVAGMDDRLTSSVVLMNFPPLEIVPEPIRGQSFVMVRGCWSGDLLDGEALINGWRSWREPVLDMFGPMPFSMADTISNDPVDPMPAMVTTEWFDTIPQQVIDTLVGAAVPQPGQMPLLLMAEIRHAGGAVRANAVHAANDTGRSGEFLLEMVGLALTADMGAALHAHLQATRAALAPFVNGATYLNFTEGLERQERTASAYSQAHLRRLQAVKDAMDSADRFCHGFGVTPR
jgi:hypothetical protein